MQNGAPTAKKFSQNFINCDMSTLKFVLLTIGTGGMWAYVWMFNLCDTINRHEKHTVIHLALPVVSMIFAFIYDIYNGLALADPDIETFLFIMSLVDIALVVTMSFMTKGPLEAMLAEYKMPLKLNPFFCVIFAICYQYYTIVNIEEYYKNKLVVQKAMSQEQMPAQNKQNEKFDQLERLSKLKQEGAITAEEFEAEKKKLLNS